MLSVPSEVTVASLIRWPGIKVEFLVAPNKIGVWRKECSGGSFVFDTSTGSSRTCGSGDDEEDIVCLTDILYKPIILLHCSCCNHFACFGQIVTEVSKGRSEQTILEPIGFFRWLVWSEVKQEDEVTWFKGLYRDLVNGFSNNMVPSMSQLLFMVGSYLSWRTSCPLIVSVSASERDDFLSDMRCLKNKRKLNLKRIWWEFLVFSWNFRRSSWSTAAPESVMPPVVSLSAFLSSHCWSRMSVFVVHPVDPLDSSYSRSTDSMLIVFFSFWHEDEVHVLHCYLSSR